MPPTMLDEGQVNLLAQPGLYYRLAMNTWRNVTSTLARFPSACTPHLSSFAQDFLLLLSCDSVTGDSEYRVLRSDGKMLLSGKAGAQQIGFDAAGSGKLFAIKVVNTAREIALGTGFAVPDLLTQEVRVHRNADAKRIFTARVAEPATSRATYAVSPDGRQLALLNRNGISLFALPEE
jgi:hypothetical protein